MTGLVGLGELWEREGGYCLHLRGPREEALGLGGGRQEPRSPSGAGLSRGRHETRGRECPQGPRGLPAPFWQLSRWLPARRLSPRGWLPAAERVWLRRQTELQAPGPPARDWLARRPQAPAAGRAPGPAVAAGDWQAGTWSCAVPPWPEARLAPARALGSHRANVCRLEILPLQSWARASSGVELRRRTHLAPAAPCVGETRNRAHQRPPGPRGGSDPAGLRAWRASPRRPACPERARRPPATPLTGVRVQGGSAGFHRRHPAFPRAFQMQGNPAGAPESRNGWGEAGGRCPASGGTGRGGARARCGQERKAEAAPPGSPTTARASAKRARRPGRLPARNGPQRASADSGRGPSARPLVPGHTSVLETSPDVGLRAACVCFHTTRRSRAVAPRTAGRQSLRRTIWLSDVEGVPAPALELHRPAWGPPATRDT